jgi:hypothetical protein
VSIRFAARPHRRRASNRHVRRADGSAASLPSSATIARVTSPAFIGLELTMLQGYGMTGPRR